jgi:hypothetical protein
LYCEVLTGTDLEKAKRRETHRTSTCHSNVNSQVGTCSTIYGKTRTRQKTTTTTTTLQTLNAITKYDAQLRKTLTRKKCKKIMGNAKTGKNVNTTTERKNTGIKIETTHDRGKTGDC